MGRGREAVVASCNVHAGVDGWGREQDALGACLALDADVLMLEEVLTPDRGTSLVAELVGRGGYTVAGEAELARAVLSRPPPGLGGTRAARWGPRGARAPALLLSGPRRVRPRPARWGERVRGSFGICLLTRLPVRSTKVVPLTPLRRDPLRRFALLAEVDLGATCLQVVGTHFPHLSDGSPLRLSELRSLLCEPGEPGVLLGDMNLFGPPLALALPGWRRAVRGRSWPAWRPICQPDHVLVSEAVRATVGEVLPPCGSDHRPVRARLSC